jgi:hypothetical protein
MIEAIMAETGWDTPTQIVRRAIEELYKQTFKYGKDPISNAGPNDSDETIARKATVKAREKQALKEAEELEQLGPKIKMCEDMLQGEVRTNENGNKVCVFTQYNFDKENELIIPLGEVDPIIAKTSLFFPSQANIFKRRPDVAKKFVHLTDNNK